MLSLFSATLIHNTVSIPIIDAVVSGGNLFEYLSDMVKQYHGQLCIRIAPIRLRFSLPCKDGNGVKISNQELQTCLHCTPSFFSDSLCCRYLITKDGNHAAVILFDDTESLQKRKHLAESLGANYLLFEA